MLLLPPALLAVGCSDDKEQKTSQTKPTVTAPTTSGAAVTEPAVTIPVSQVKVKLTEVGEFDQPLAIVGRAGHEALYIAERAGRVRVINGKEILQSSLVDISDETTTEGERGLLGITFSPDGNKLYISFTDERGDSRLDEFTMGPGISDIDLGSRRTLLKVNQPFQNHNGGYVTFGPDAMLYLGLGDGGSSGDPDERSQDLTELLGKILRIDPRPQGSAPYSIPADNPFVDATKFPNSRPEIWAYGLRNPWRFSFDRAKDSRQNNLMALVPSMLRVRNQKCPSCSVSSPNGDLWVADVGQDAIEEVNWVKSGEIAGTNFGWDFLEGTRRFEGSAPGGLTGPVYEYGRSAGRSITGGFVYRGTKIAGLQGRYLFGDLITARIWALEPDQNQKIQRHDLGVGVDEGTLVSFGEDLAGDLYVVSIGGSVFRVDPA